MSHRKTSLRTQIIIVKITMASILIATLISALVTHKYNRIIYIITSTLLIIAPDLLRKFHNLQFSDRAELAYLSFIFISAILGINLDLYHSTAWLDKLSHTLSGALTAIVAWLILKHRHLIDTPTSFKVVFILSFSLAIAVIWEIYEFLVNFILHTDPQRVISTGVTDTMLDLIVAGLGAATVTVYLFRKKTAKPKSSA